MRAILCLAVGAGFLVGAGAQADEALLTSPLARVFGAAPRMAGARLAPDGRKVSYLQVNDEGRSLLGVIDLDAGSVDLVLAGEVDGFDISWCDWANQSRILCGFRAINETRYRVFETTRLVAVDADGSNALPLLQARLGQYQDAVIDWLHDEPRHVLIQLPAANGYATARLNIYDATLEDVTTWETGSLAWATDSHGNVRMQLVRSKGRFEIHIRASSEAPWHLWREIEFHELNTTFSPEGIGSGDEYYYVDDLDGRLALFVTSAQPGAEPRLVFAHPRVDVDSLRSIGKYERAVAAVYAEEHTKIHYFDERVAEIDRMVRPQLDNTPISVVDEDWDQRNYLFFASSDTNPGGYLHFDTATRTLTRLAQSYPAVAAHTLVPMHPVTYSAKDGTPIPGYLTLPTAAELPPAVLLPHGGPRSRDYWGYDFLVQFLAASGYAVLQSNYRGSTGYGDEWIGGGAYREWRLAVGDVVDGANYLIEQGLVDPDRICAAGWSFGGYLALQAAVEAPGLLRCVVSIAGITDLQAHANRYSEEVNEFIGLSKEIYETGSPRRRIDEITVPVLLFHGEWDSNVYWRQSLNYERALARRGKAVEFVRYDEAEHSIEKLPYRIDLLTRLGGFLSDNIGSPAQ